jgi:glycosyltransferase involved in cell wall biosynthesis
MNPEIESRTDDMPVLSAIVCTHNPRGDYLSKVIESLKAQVLNRTCWELLFIDNASTERLENNWDLSWHPNARHVREDELGLTPARLRGIRESRGKFLVFVDDDNILEPDYLAQAVRLGEEWPSLGAWGGSVSGEFEFPPQSWTEPYWDYICVRECREPRWSNNPGDWSSLPFGAGLCIRAELARLYSQLSKACPYRQMLDRKGTGLMASGDIDMVLLGRMLGLGFGRFPALRMSHLIPAWRLSEDYLVELVQSTSLSNVLLSEIHSGVPVHLERRRPSIFWSLLCFLRQGRRGFRFHRARVRGTLLGTQLIAATAKQTRNSTLRGDHFAHKLTD